jgi:hypothetical protein
MISEKQNLEIARFQKEIESYLSLGETSVIFEYNLEDRGVRLNVVTINPKHKQSFLFFSTIEDSKIEALRAALDYVQSYKEKSNSYTIQWSLKDQKELQTSYFRAKDMLEAIDKLFFGRDPNTIALYSIVLNPIT